MTLLSHKKEQNGVICKELETITQSEIREKQIFYINTYIQNLKKLV